MQLLASSLSWFFFGVISNFHFFSLVPFYLSSIFLWIFLLSKQKVLLWKTWIKNSCDSKEKKINWKYLPNTFSARRHSEEKLKDKQHYSISNPADSCFLRRLIDFQFMLIWWIGLDYKCLRVSEFLEGFLKIWFEWIYQWIFNWFS